MSSSNRNRKGFTLVELLVTISILAILSAVTVVGYTNFIKRTAIEVDESLVEQLNIFTDAYLVKHYSNLPEDKKIITDVLDESGVKPLTLQSKEYGYDLWFKCADKTFELKENFLETEGYIRVTDNISFDDNNIEQPGTTTTTPGNTTNNKEENCEPSEDDPVFILEDFVQNEDCDKAGYVYASDNAIFVGIEKKANQEIIPAVLLIEKIKIKSLDKDGNPQYWSVISIEYNGITDSNGIMIDQPGAQEIKFLLHNRENGETNSYVVTVYSVLISTQDTYITIDENILRHSLKISPTSDTTYDVAISIIGFKEGLNITTYDFNTVKSYTNPFGKFDYNTKVEMEICFNGERKKISASQMFSDKVSQKYTDLVITSEEINCIVIYRYFDCNGTTVEKRYQIK